MPALAPSLFSKSLHHSDFWQLAFFLYYYKNKPFPTVDDFLWVVREFSELFILVNCISSRERTKSRSCIVLHGVCLQLNSKEGGIKPGVVTDVSEVPVWPGGIFLLQLPALLTPFLYSICMSKKEPSLAGRGRPGNLWINSSVLIYGTLYMEIMMLL